MIDDSQLNNSYKLLQVSETGKVSYDGHYEENDTGGDEFDEFANGEHGFEDE